MAETPIKIYMIEEAIANFNFSKLLLEHFNLILQMLRQAWIRLGNITHQQEVMTSSSSSITKLFNAGGLTTRLV